MNLFLQAVIEFFEEIPKGFIRLIKNARFIGKLVGEALFILVPFVALALLDSGNFFFALLAPPTWAFFSFGVLIKMDAIEERERRKEYLVQWSMLVHPKTAEAVYLLPKEAGA